MHVLSDLGLFVVQLIICCGVHACDCYIRLRVFDTGVMWHLNPRLHRQGDPNVFGSGALVHLVYLCIYVYVCVCVCVCVWAHDVHFHLQL
jgi:hypothetical protein